MIGYTVDSDATDSDSDGGADTPTNTKADIPEGERHEVANTNLDVPDIEDPFEWLNASRNGMGKVNLYFGYDVDDVGGCLGEIDNFTEDGEEVWGLTTREIIQRGDTTVPKNRTDISNEYDSLDAAIQAVPDLIGTFYATD